jgi:hypothetical protein
VIASVPGSVCADGVFPEPCASDELGDSCAPVSFPVNRTIPITTSATAAAAASPKLQILLFMVDLPAVQPTLSLG